jgi:hypothetical protein
VKRARIDTPYPSRSATAKALGVTKTRMRQLASLFERLLRESGKGDRTASSVRKSRASLTAKRSARAHAR